MWSEHILKVEKYEFCRNFNVKIPICSSRYLRNQDLKSVLLFQVGFIDFIVLPLWETLAELMYPFCQEMLTQLNENRNYYFNRIPESPRGSITDGPGAEERSTLISNSEKRKTRKGIPEEDKLSDLSSIDEADEVAALESTT